MDHLAQRLCALHIYAEESTRNSKPVRADKRGVYVEILQAPLDQRPHHALGVLLITAAQQNDPSIRLLAEVRRNIGGVGQDGDIAPSFGTCAANMAQVLPVPTMIVSPSRTLWAAAAAIFSFAS